MSPELEEQIQCFQLWDDERVLDKLRKTVLEWYIELQCGKPCTPSLSILSFERRQLQRRKEKKIELKGIQNAPEIIAYGCKLLSGERALLEAYLAAVFTVLTFEPKKILRERNFQASSSSFSRNLGPSGVEFQLSTDPASSSSFSRNLGPSGVEYDLDSDTSIASETSLDWE